MGCGDASETAQLQHKEQASSGWIEQHSSAADGSVSVIQSQMTAAQIAEFRNSYKRANLIQLPIDTKFNAILFRITDETIPDDENRAFVAPKLFSYGTEQGGQIARVAHGDGTVTLSFNIAFVDGISQTLLSASGDEREIALPSEFFVNHRSELEKSLTDDFGMKSGLASLSGCPKKITLVVGGQEFDTTLKDLAQGDFCELNVPIAVSLTVSQSDAKIILEKTLMQGLVDVRGVYETKVSFPVANIKLSFDRSKIYRELQTELAGKAGVVDADAKLAVSRVMQNQLLKVSVQGDLNEMLGALIAQVMQEFFEPLSANSGAQGSANTSDKTSACQAAGPCLRLAASQLHETNTLDFTWVQATDSVTGQNYITSTKLKATPTKVVLGLDSNCETNCDRLENDGAPRETGLTVVNGTKVSIEPSYVMKESRQTPGQTTRVDHSVCVATGQVCWIQFLSLDCNQQCTKTENQWVDTTHFYEGSSTSVLIREPAGMLDQMYEGFLFQFDWIDSASGKKQTLQCPLGVFPREGAGQSLSVKLQNVPTCAPFTESGIEVPMLSLVNRISFPENYLEGDLVKNWKGEVLSSPVQRIFYPKVEFVGAVSISE